MIILINLVSGTFILCFSGFSMLVSSAKALYNDPIIFNKINLPLSARQRYIVGKVRVFRVLPFQQLPSFEHVLVWTTAAWVCIRISKRSFKALFSSSTGIGEAAYNSEWFQADDEIKKVLKFILHRSQRPKYVTAHNLGVVSLNSYASVSRILGYYSMIKFGNWINNAL